MGSSTDIDKYIGDLSDFSIYSKQFAEALKGANNYLSDISKKLGKYASFLQNRPESVDIEVQLRKHPEIGTRLKQISCLDELLEKTLDLITEGIFKLLKDDVLSDNEILSRINDMDYFEKCSFIYMKGEKRKPRTPQLEVTEEELEELLSYKNNPLLDIDYKEKNTICMDKYAELKIHYRKNIIENFPQTDKKRIEIDKLLRKTDPFIREINRYANSNRSIQGKIKKIVEQSDVIIAYLERKKIDKATLEKHKKLLDVEIESRESLVEKGNRAIGNLTSLVNEYYGVEVNA